MDNSPLINASEALALHGAPDVKFVDVTWFMPNVPKNAREIYENEHIAGAVYFDIDQIADTASDLPHMYPSLSEFETHLGAMGISDRDQVIVYDRSNFVASARAWWMLVSFGHARVQVLNGGLSAWNDAGGAVEDSVPDFAPQNYSGQPSGESVILYDELLANMTNESMAIVDARSPGRFNGTEPEPRPGLRGGHIPGSANLYYADIIDSNGMMRLSSEVEAMLDSKSIQSDTTIVSTCGSGVTAAIVLLAIYQFRRDGLRLYDGSWTEWALDSDSPIETR